MKFIIATILFLTISTHAATIKLKCNDENVNSSLLISYDANKKMGSILFDREGDITNLKIVNVKKLDSQFRRTSTLLKVLWKII